ncbi:MAG: tetratricopeptide repeat protein [Proteobacteria bacterium]|nr:tetratricopeptide repeat protein [Pseudomonadota bacterium]
MKHTMKLIFILAFVIGVSSCKQSQHKQSEMSEVSEVNTLLTNITIDALKEQNFIQAQRSISAIILSGDNDAWRFIQSALVSMPEEMAMQVIDSALKQPSVLQSSNQLFSIAKVYISYKNTNQALKIINQSIALDKNNLQAKYWRARLLVVMKDYDNAERDFKFITKKEPSNETFSGQYAAFFQETDQFKKAQEILSSHEQTPDNLFKRIIFALQNNDTETASEVYPLLKNVEVDSEKENHKYFLTAEAAYWLKNTQESELYYSKISGGNHYLDAREMLSLILFDQERYDESIEILHQLQNAEENFAVKAYRLESQIAKKQGDVDEAIQILSRSLQILPSNSGLLYDRAMLYESQSKMSKVEEDLLQIIEDNPNHYEALNALGYSLADHDLKLKKAYEYVLRAIELSPDSAAILDSVGWVQYKLGKYTDAEENFKKALAKEINDPELYIHMYKTLLKLNKNQEAKELILKAKELFPNNEELIILN